MSIEAVRRGQERLDTGIKALINEHAGESEAVDQITSILIDIETILGNLSRLSDSKRKD